MSAITRHRAGLIGRFADGIDEGEARRRGAEDAATVAAAADDADAKIPMLAIFYFLKLFRNENTRVCVLFGSPDSLS